MKPIKAIILFSILLLINSCITKFIPETDENKELLVVEGLITDQRGINTVKLSKSLPLGRKNVAKPLKGCIVYITEDPGISYRLTETVPGTYITDSTKFRGKIGRRYTLRINANIFSYESTPMVMKPVPPIDSIFYERRLIKEKDKYNPAQEGCQIYLNTHDPANNCQFYRWEYTETWEFRLPYSVTNRICWISNNSSVINIKNTGVLAEDIVNRYPLNFISNETDRLKVKYSMLVNQYSLNEDEFDYWEKLQHITEEVGSLYDITPAAIPSNIYCIDDPNEKVLGYFSVSAKSSNRIFIKDYFSGIVNLYSDCPSDTIFGTQPIPNLNVDVWVIEDNSFAVPPTRIITDKKGCADCTVRGTNVKPVFWTNDK